MLFVISCSVFYRLINSTPDVYGRGYGTTVLTHCMHACMWIVGVSFMHSCHGDPINKTAHLTAPADEVGTTVPASVIPGHTSSATCICVGNDFFCGHVIHAGSGGYNNIFKMMTLCGMAYGYYSYTSQLPLMI